MSSTPHSLQEPDPSSRDPRPLTQSARDGRRYIRHEDVEDEIRTALAAEPASWAPGSLKNETLVHLIRSLRWRDEMANILGRLFDQLGRRVVVIVGDYSKGFPKSVREEIHEHVSHEVVKLVLAETPTRKSDFLEVEFKKVVKGLTLNEADKRRRQPRPHQFMPVANDPDSLADQGTELPDDGPGPEEIAESREVNDLLRAKIDSIADPRHREAVVLYYLQGWPITDQDPTKPTLCNYFHISERQIRNWIQRALAEMRKAMGDEI